MTQKTVAITGASNGMGFEATKLLPNVVGKFMQGRVELTKFPKMVKKLERLNLTLQTLTQ